MKSLKPWIAAVLALALCVASGVRAAQTAAPEPGAGVDSFLQQPKPRISKAAGDAIQQMLQAYAALKHYQGAFTLTLSQQQGEKKQTITTTGAVTIERPGKVSVGLISGKMHYSITCDGKECLAYYSPSNKYLKWKEPSNLDQVLLDPSLLQVFGDMVRVTTIPFAQNAYRDFMIGVSEADVVPSQAGQPIHVQLNVTSGLLDFYVDPKSHLVTQAHALPTHLIEAAKAANPNLGEIKASSDLKLQAAAPGAPLPADAFSTTPPKGAGQAVSIQDLLQAPPVKEMVDFTLPSLTGQKVKLSDHRGKVILLDFWATWCPPCRAELPMLQEVYNDLKGKGLVFLAVNVGEKKDKVTAFLKAQDLDIPVVLDAKADAYGAYHGQVLPTLYLIGKDGKVVERRTSFDARRRDEIKAELEKTIKDALAAPAKATTH